ncbi:hypothetical protein A2U01_0084408, partial [Trifolium medium]|nr:hypothetical protein [Trifolium medium]
MGRSKRRDSDHTSLNLHLAAADETGEGLLYAS